MSNALPSSYPAPRLLPHIRQIPQSASPKEAAWLDSHGLPPFECYSLWTGTGRLRSRTPALSSSMVDGRCCLFIGAKWVHGGLSAEGRAEERGMGGLGTDVFLSTVDQ